MNKGHIQKLERIIGQLETLQRRLLHSPKHKNDTAIENLERAKTELLRALRKTD